MKFIDFLNEGYASKAAIAEIDYIELDVKDDQLELLVYFTNNDIKEHEARHFAEMFDYPSNSDQDFVTTPRAFYRVTVESDGYKYFDEIKEFAEENDISIDNEEDDR